jgi:hypothetical protein
MALSRQEDQQVRLDVLRNDQRLRNQGSTFSQFAEAEAAEARGRYSAVNAASVVGSSPNVSAQYPAAADWTRDPVGPEMPLGVSINEMPSCGEQHELKASVPSPEPSPAQATDPGPASDNAPPPTSRGGVERDAAVGTFSSHSIYRRA